VPDLAFNGESTPVQFYDRLRKGQPETGALMPAVEYRIDTIKGLNHQRDVFGADADSGIPDSDA
jgi:hypothetical protein